MAETPYQNIDISQNNPLGFKEEMASPTPRATSKKLNPKIIFLIIMGIFIFLLLIISLIVTSLRKKGTSLPSQKITPSPTEAVIPTVSKSLLPEIYQGKFDTIENNLGDILNIDVPTLDLEIGL